MVDSQVEGRLATLADQCVDDQPNVEAPAIAIINDTTINLNYQDRNAYDTHWVEETASMEKLVFRAIAIVRWRKCL